MEKRRSKRDDLTQSPLRFSLSSSSSLLESEEGYYSSEMQLPPSGSPGVKYYSKAENPQQDKAGEFVQSLHALSPAQNYHASGHAAWAEEIFREG